MLIDVSADLNRLINDIQKPFLLSIVMNHAVIVIP